MTSRTQILTAKQKKSLKKSIPRSQGKTKQKSVRRSKKNIAGQVLKYNPKNLNNASQNNQHLFKKLRNKPSNKLNKNIIIAKTLKLLPLRQNLIPLNTPISKICSKQIFVSEIIAALYLHGLKKFIDPFFFKRN